MAQRRHVPLEARLDHLLERLAHQEFLLGWVFENPEADFVAEAPVLRKSSDVMRAGSD
jgi:hypothetical protein